MGRHASTTGMALVARTSEPKVGIQDVKREVRSASILKDGRAVFNIAGNKYRIVVWINYPYRVVYIRFIGNHRDYDAIDAQTI